MATLKMNLQYFAGEKTEKATPRKRQDTRKKGQVAKSNELPSAIIFLFMFILFYVLGSSISQNFINLYKKIFTKYLVYQVTVSNIRLVFLDILSSIVWVIFPIFAVALVGALAGNLIQVGFLITGEPLKVKLNKLNPIEGAKKIFSTKALIELAKSLLKITIVGYIAFSVIWSEKSTLIALYHYNLSDILAFSGSLILQVGLKTSILLIILALLDYLYQRYEHEKNIKMSKQDIKDEHKKTEGDPLIKSKIKERQRQMAMSRMMQSVPEADVIITNPTHFAVAIMYKPKEMGAPQVVAKGMDYIALKIKEVAKENDISTVENRWLARTLYHQVEIGDSIPADLFQAVAEVLAYVYKIKGLAKS